MASSSTTRNLTVNDKSNRRPSRRRLTVEIPRAVDDMLEMYTVAFAAAKQSVTEKALAEFLSTRKKDLLSRFTHIFEAASGDSSSPRAVPTVTESLVLPPAQLAMGIFSESADNSHIQVVGAVAGYMARNLWGSPYHLLGLNANEFEELIMDRIAAMGNEVRRAGNVNQADGGVDFVFWPKKGLRVLGAVQEKHHSAMNRKSDVEIVKGMVATLAIHRSEFNLGMVVTNTAFTESAKLVVDPFRIFLRLREGDQVMQWIEGDFSSESDLPEFPMSISLTKTLSLDLTKPE
jgi:hypothetical protein